jgi:hypothetical protein
VTSDTDGTPSGTGQPFAFGVSSPALGVTPPTLTPGAADTATFSAAAISAATKKSPATVGGSAAAPTFSFGSPGSVGLPAAAGGSPPVFSFGAAKSPAAAPAGAGSKPFAFGAAKSEPPGVAAASEPELEPELEPEPEPEPEAE